MSFPDVEDVLYANRRVVAVVNGKGGVYKTTTADNVAAAFAAQGRQVLVVDLDRQGNTILDFFGESAVFGPEGEILIGDEGRHLSAALQGLVPLAAVLSDVRPGLDLVTGGKYLDDIVGILQTRIMRDGRPSVILMLARALAPLAQYYDVIILDCPPGDALLQLLALGAARWMLVPTKPDSASVLGLKNLADLLPEVRGVNPYVEVAGVMLVGVGKTATRVRSDAEARIQRVLGGAAPLFPTVIRPSVPLSVEFRKQGKLAAELRGQRGLEIAGEIADEYMKTAEELENRMADAEAEENAVLAGDGAAE